MENKTAKQKESVIEFKSNAIGNTDLKIIRAQALEKAVIGRSIENDKLANGYRWMHKGNTSRLVHPNRFLEYSK